MAPPTSEVTASFHASTTTTAGKRWFLQLTLPAWATSATANALPSRVLLAGAPDCSHHLRCWPGIRVGRRSDRFRPRSVLLQKVERSPDARGQMTDPEERGWQWTDRRHLESAAQTSRVTPWRFMLRRCAGTWA